PDQLRRPWHTLNRGSAPEGRPPPFVVATGRAALFLLLALRAFSYFFRLGGRPLRSEPAARARRFHLVTRYAEHRPDARLRAAARRAPASRHRRVRRLSVLQQNHREAFQRRTSRSRQRPHLGGMGRWP